MKLCRPTTLGLRSQRDNRREQGLMLLEAVAYVALLALVLELALGAFYVAFQNNRDLTRNADDIARTLTAGERWRTDVRHAGGALELVTNTITGEIELRLPQKTNAVVYTFHEGAMLCQAAGETNAITVLDRIKRSEFVRDPRSHVTAWRWEIELETKRKVARVRPLFTFQAVEPTEVKR